METDIIMLYLEVLQSSISGTEVGGWNLQEVIIRGDALTSLAASALTIQPHSSILLHCHSLSVTGVCLTLSSSYY